MTPLDATARDDARFERYSSELWTRRRYGSPTDSPTLDAQVRSPTSSATVARPPTSFNSMGTRRGIATVSPLPIGVFTRAFRNLRWPSHL